MGLWPTHDPNWSMPLRLTCLLRLLILFIRLYLSGIWLGVAPKTDITKNMCSKRIELCTQNMIIILDSIVNIIWGWARESSLHFDIE